MTAVASKGNNRDGEMVLCFRALAVLAEDLFGSQHPY